MEKKIFTICLSFLSFICTVKGQTITKPDSANFASIKKSVDELPLLMKLSNSKKKLTYFGTYHTNQPNDSLFIRLQYELDLINPDVILFEGVENIPIFDNIDTTILHSGEPGFAIHYAKTKGIKYVCIEPKDSLEYADLLSKFSKKEVVLYYLCRQIGNIQRRDIGISEEEFTHKMNGFLEFMRKRGMPLVDEELDFFYWKKEFRRLLGFSLKWRTMDNNIHYPNQYNTILNNVSRVNDNFRNSSMVRTIFYTLVKYDKVFVLVGWGHLMLQEPSIRKKWNTL